MLKKFFVIPFCHSKIPIYKDTKYPMTEPK